LETPSFNKLFQSVEIKEQGVLLFPVGFQVAATKPSKKYTSQLFRKW